MTEVLHGGRVFTSDPNDLWAEAIAFDGERVIHVGDYASAVDAAGAGATLTDVRGGVVLPGFVDAHAHLTMTGDALLRAQLRAARDIGAIRGSLSAWAAANPDAPRIVGVGWLYSALPDSLPTRQMLDVIDDDRPIYAEAADLHSCWLNSAALAELGIDASTPDPIGGRIVRDPVTGEATGHLLENASVNTVWPLLANVDEATNDAHLAAAVAAYNSSGVTTAVDMAVEGEML
ncbi:MAG: putative hydrolase, partial [Ilumatobacteraceae bacterium]|nr:putative hydrolase [Ilumatobacteraceae bacterium]